MNRGFVVDCDVPTALPSYAANSRAEIAVDNKAWCYCEIHIARHIGNHIEMQLNLNGRKGSRRDITA